MKEVEDANKDIPRSWIGRINIKMSTLLQRNLHRFIATSIKILRAFFTEIEQTILKSVWNNKGLNSQSNLEKEEHLYFKLYYKATVIKTMLLE